MAKKAAKKSVRKAVRKRSKSSGSGERRAIRGAIGQYRYAAYQILQSIERRELEFIHLADPNAGQLDDLQIAERTVHHAFQIKWNLHPRPITRTHLIKPGESGESLVRQLASSWQQLKAQRTARRTIVHLVENDYPSTNRWKNGTNKSLAQFLDEAWRPFQDGESKMWGQGWDMFWHDFQGQAQLNDASFEEFVKDCRLDFGVSIPGDLPDIDHVREHLLTQTAGPQRILEFSKEELLDLLGWTNRYVLHPEHSFLLPPYYEVIEPATSSLTSALVTHNKGYLALVGSPGSGKSSLLTATLRRSGAGLHAYYAFIQDGQYPNRGGSTDFLHRITASLETVVQVRGRRPAPNDEQALHARFLLQVHELGERYKQNSLKTVVLVDGLDHLYRDPLPERSLLSVLPSPNILPDGFYIVLGTQKLELPDLSAAIKSELASGSRTIVINPLARASVEQIAAQHAPRLSTQERDRVFEVTSGHPLALKYLLNQLVSIDDEADRKRLLDSSTAFTGLIDRDYELLWDEVKAESDIVEFLALLSRIRGRIPMALIRTWFDLKIARRIEPRIKHFFDTDGDFWSFFHNSFQVFLRNRTSEPVLGASRDELERQFHKELAYRLGQAPQPHSWDVLFHLSCSGDLDGVVRLATPAHFQEQLEGFRSFQVVLEDVRLSIAAAEKVGNPSTLVRMFLTAAAIEQQWNIVADSPTVDLLLGLEMTTQAIAQVRVGSKLLVSREFALKTAFLFYEKEHIREAERLFDLAEPYELLAGLPVPRSTWNHEQSFDLLKAWAALAVAFRAPEVVQRIIQTVQPEREEYATNDQEETNTHWRVTLLRECIKSCARLRDKEAWSQYLGTLSSIAEGWTFEAIADTIVILRGKDQSWMKELLTRLVDEFAPPQPLRDLEGHAPLVLDLVELILTVLGDKRKAEEWLGAVPAFPLYSRGYGTDQSKLAEARYKRYCLNIALDAATSWESMSRQDAGITVWPKHMRHDEEGGARQLSFALGRLAYLQSERLNDRKVEPASFLKEARHAISWIQKPNTTDSPDLHITKQAVRPFVIHLLVFIAGGHGEACISALVSECKSAIGIGGWYPSMIRSLVSELSKVGYAGYASEVLSELDARFDYSGEPRDRVDDLRQHAALWLTLGDKEKARAHMVRMAKMSRGPEREHDAQFVMWTNWLVRTNRVDSAGAMNRTRALLSQLLDVHDVSTDGSGALEIILGECFRIDPMATVTLVKKLQENRVLRHNDAVGSVLLAAAESGKVRTEVLLHSTCQLLMPFGGPGRPGLLSTILRQSMAKDGLVSAVAHGKYLFHRVCAETIPSDKSHWCRQLATACGEMNVDVSEVGLRESDLIDPDGRYSSSTGEISMPDGMTLTLEQAKEHVRSVDDFIHLYRGQNAESSYAFHWMGLLEHTVGLVNSEVEVTAMAAAINDGAARGHLAEALGELSIRAKSVGLTELASRLSESAVERSDERGWDRWLDGGSRIRAFTALQQSQGAQGSAMARKCLVDDYLNGALSARRLLLNLDAILPLLSDEIDWPQIWPVAQEYLDLLCHGYRWEATNSDELWPSSVEGVSDETFSVGVLELLCVYLDHPVNLLAVRSAGALGRIAVFPEITGLVLRALSKSRLQGDQAVLLGLLVMKTGALHWHSHIELVRSEVMELLRSENIQIRRIASQVCADLAIGDGVLPQYVKALPTAYTLHIPTSSTYRTDARGWRDAIPQVGGDPAERMRPFDMDIRMVAEWAEVNEQVAINRAYAQFEQLEKVQSWFVNPDHENPLGHFAKESLGHVKFSAARVHPAANAALRLAGELWDAERLSIGAVEAFTDGLNTHDSGWLLVDPQPKPEWIASMSGLSERTRNWSIPEGWVENVKDAHLSLGKSTGDGWTIIAEESVFNYLGNDEHMEEERLSFIGQRPRGQVSKRAPAIKDFVEYAHQVPVLGYLSCSESQVVIVRNRHHNPETPGMRWIAVNPNVAQKLGLTKGTMPFEWNDEEGQLAVRSVWWKEGGTHRFDSHSDCVSSEGWLVVIRPDMYERLQTLVSGLHRLESVTRRTGFGIETTESSSAALVAIA